MKKKNELFKTISKKIRRMLKNFKKKNELFKSNKEEEKWDIVKKIEEKNWEVIYTLNKRKQKYEKCTFAFSLICFIF